MITIGINENVFIGTETKKNDKGTLLINFAQSDPAAADLKKKLEEDPFAEWNEGSGYSSGDSTGIKMFMFPFDAKPPQSDPDKVMDALVMKERVDSVRAPLFHILEQFYAFDQNPLKPKAIFAGTKIGQPGGKPTDFSKYILDEEVQKKVYNNMVDTFLDAMAPHLGKEDKLFRLLLIRQSAKKAFPTLRTKFLGDQPFLEPMAIPADASKIKFTSYEKNNKLDSADPISQDTADNAAKSKSNSEPVIDPFANA